jgi:hypothetical protein
MLALSFSAVSRYSSATFSYTEEILSQTNHSATFSRMF